MFCAATITSLSAVRAATVCRAVNGGQIRISTSEVPKPGRNASRNASASALVLFIFQLAATRNLRNAAGLFISVVERLYAGRLLSLEQLERRAAAGRDVGDGVGQAEAGDCG